MNILGIVPARGGSKGIPHKNMVSVGGRPLIAYTIVSAFATHHLGKVVVSSDDEDILAISERYGAQPIRRPAEFAGDDAAFEDAITHVLDYLQAVECYTADILVYLQPTSPLRTVADIDGAIQLLLDREATSVVSVQEIDRGYLKVFIEDNNGYLTGAVNNAFPFMNRQDLPSVYMPNGAVYVTTVTNFVQNRSLFSKKTLPYIMPESRSLDIDTYADLQEFEAKLTIR